MTDTELVRRLFDDVADVYDQHVPFFATSGRALVRWLELRPGQRVLDVATGRGAIAVPAAEAVGESGEVLAVRPDAEVGPERRRISRGRLGRAGDAGAS